MGTKQDVNSELSHALLTSHKLLSGQAAEHKAEGINPKLITGCTVLISVHSAACHSLIVNEMQQWCSSPSNWVIMEPARNMEMIAAGGSGYPRGCARAARTLRLWRCKGEDKSQGCQGEQRSGENFTFPSVLFGVFLCEFPSRIPRDNFLPALGRSEHSDTAQSSTSV